MSLVLGVDFDNTIICYDNVFYDCASKKYHIPAEIGRDKASIKKFLVDSISETAWTELQGEVYGPGILSATIFEGVIQTLSALTEKGTKIVLISHKTRHPYIGPPYDLHAAALHWLETHYFFSKSGLAWSRSQVFFETTIQRKVERIHDQHCDFFLDDLQEVLRLIPGNVQKIHFNPHKVKSRQHKMSWREITKWRDLPQVIYDC